jgi:hypothetical protein
VQGHGWKLYFRVRPRVEGQVGNLLSIGCCTTSLLVRSFVICLRHNKLRHESVLKAWICDNLYGGHLKLKQISNPDYPIKPTLRILGLLRLGFLLFYFLGFNTT